MSDDIPSSGPGGPEELGPNPAEQESAAAAPPHSPQWSHDFVGFVQRLLFAIGFAVVAWAVFWLILLLLAPMQYIHLAVTGRVNDELKHLSLRGVHYLVELLAYVTAIREEKPFPFGPFPQL